MRESLQIYFDYIPEIYLGSNQTLMPKFCCEWRKKQRSKQWVALSDRRHCLIHLLIACISQGIPRQIETVPTNSFCPVLNFQGNTDVWIVWAWRDKDDASSGLNANLKHTATGILRRKYNLIMEATGMKPTEKNAAIASQSGARFVVLSMLVLIAYTL